MAEESNKTQLTTLQYRNKYKRESIIANVAKYVSPAIPASVVTGINWDEWFSKSGVSLPFGFATLLISVLLSVYLILKKDEELLKKFSPLITATVLITLFGVSFMFLASIGDQIGKLFLYTAVGLLGSIGADEVDKLVIKPKLKVYQELVDKYGLDEKAKAKRLREEQAKLEQERQAQEEANKEATE